LSVELTKGIRCEHVRARENWIFPRADARRSRSSSRTRMLRERENEGRMRTTKKRNCREERER